MKDRDLIRQAMEQTQPVLRTSTPESQSARPSVPDVPGYELVREIHRGGQGVLLQGLQLSTGQMVAVKLLRHRSLATVEERARLDREVEILAHIKDPLIVTVIDRGVTGEGHPFIVMDYIDGMPLDAFVAESQPDLKSLIELLSRLGRAVHAAHVQGIVHRDLKPANILVTASGQPHIVDFGLARGLESDTKWHTLTQSQRFLGTLPWASPEQIRSSRDGLDARSDVYALGVIFWHLLTGQFPYPIGPHPHDNIISICEHAPQMPGHPTYKIDRDLETILRQCLAKEPERRYQTCREVSTELDRWSAGEPIDARRSSIGYVLKKSIRRHWVLTSFTSFLLMTIITAAVGFALLYMQAERARRNAQRTLNEMRLGRFDPLPGLESFVDDFKNPEVDDRFIGLAPATLRTPQGLILQTLPSSGASYWLDPTKRILRGDFDIEVDYVLEHFPDIDQGMLKFGLALFEPYKRLAICFWGRVREHNPQCEGWPEDIYHFDWDPQRDCTGHIEATGDLSGKLRLRRRGTELSTSYWNEGWQVLQVTSVTDDILSFGIYADRVFTDTDIKTRVTRLAVSTVYKAKPNCLPSIDDRFDGSALDPRFDVENKHASIYKNDGSLLLQKRNGNTGRVAYKLRADQWRLCGDFDLAVDFRLIDFPEPESGEHFFGLEVRAVDDDSLLAEIRYLRGLGNQSALVIQGSQEREKIIPAPDVEQEVFQIDRTSSEIRVCSVSRDQFWTVGQYSGEAYFVLYSDATDLEYPHTVAIDRLTVKTDQSADEP